MNPHRTASNRIDLHIHTALSPCAEEEMTPPKIIHAARAKGLKMIAVTDHNTAENVAATVKAAEGSGIVVIPGLEVQTREEVHMICLFPDIESCLKMQDLVYKNLPNLPNRKDLFGPQTILDSSGNAVSELDRMLLISAEITVESAVGKAARLGGICFPAHIDRPSFSLLSALGFIPTDLPIQSVELSKLITADEAAYRFPFLNSYTLVSSSDAHCLKDIGSNPTLLFSDSPPDFNILKLALGRNSDRKVLAKMKELAMHIIDLVQNSIEAGASEIRLTICEESASDLFSLEIADNGRGMDETQLQQATDAFYTTRSTRKIGLGLPLLKAAAERCSGKMLLSSVPGIGTTVLATFSHRHVDRAPLGNIIDTIVNLVAGNPDLSLYFLHRIDNHEVEFNARELRNQLEDVPLNNPAVLSWIKKYLNESYEKINDKQKN